MIVLDYRLEPAELRKLDGRDLGALTTTQLDYYLFCGSIIFRIEGVTFDAIWGWVPVMDFATQLFEISCDVKSGETRRLEFTESDAALSFSRLGEQVAVHANYSTGAARVPVQELKIAAKKFLSRVVTDFATKWPELSA